MPLLVDIGANRGDATLAGLEKGFDVIAIEPSRIFGELVKSFIYSEKVTPLKLAISDSDQSSVTFYEADEDGLSTLNKEWLTSDSLPYAGKPYRETTCPTITLDKLIQLYGEPDLIKIDVEGAEWKVFRGLTRKSGKLTFEWTIHTIEEHQAQLAYLADLGYTEVAPQFITHHLQEPSQWLPIETDVKVWIDENAKAWESDLWKEAGLRPTADVGMMWVR